MNLPTTNIPSSFDHAFTGTHDLPMLRTDAERASMQATQQLNWQFLAASTISTHAAPAKHRVSVVIPALNEADNLPYVLPRIPSWVDEVLLVDGNSTDNTVEVARVLPLLELDGDGFEIETMMNVRALRAGLKVVEMPSFEAERVHGVGRLRRATRSSGRQPRSLGCCWR